VIEATFNSFFHLPCTPNKHDANSDTQATVTATTHRHEYPQNMGEVLSFKTHIYTERQQQQQINSYEAKY
jgi:hypothetical protein